jgi:hypothetical protein
VSAVAVLLGLLVVAYVGGQLMGQRTSGFSLASGAEYVLLGLVLGPYALGVVEHSTLDAFEPLAVVGTAWLTLVIGAGYGFVGTRRVRLGGLLGGVLLSACSVACTAGVVHWVGLQVTSFRGQDLLLVSAGVGLVSSETTRHAVRWVVGRHSAKGPLAELVSEIADSTDLVPIFGLMASFSAVSRSEGLPMELPAWSFSGMTLVLGFGLGIIATALLRAEPRASDAWGVVLGAALLGIGLSWRIGLSPQTVTFVMGLTLSALSRHGAELRAMLDRSERPVLLPTLLLAGGQVKVPHVLEFAAIAAAALAARVVVRLLAAPFLLGIAGGPRRASRDLALGLLPTGALAMTIGLVFSMRFGGPVGDVVLASGAFFTVLGELVGPAALKRALVRAGEVDTSPDPVSGPSTPAPEVST